MSSITTGRVAEMAEICAELTKNGIEYKAWWDGHGWIIEIIGTIRS